jgi:hypothetical protein
MLGRTTSENIKELKENEVFCFGSNLLGAHGAGAARFAAKKFGAEAGVGFGPTGQCYALPTKDHNIRTMKIEEIKPFVELFITEARLDPERNYLVTEVGCGLAGFEPKDIAPLFKDAKDVPNIHLPQRFWDIILK